MKVLLTGATGFVGSQLLDQLCARDISTRLLLRPKCNTRFIKKALNRSLTEIVEGEINQTEALQKATRDVTHIIHCAGLTKAIEPSEFYEVNQHGTRRLVEAANYRGKQIRQFTLISSLAAAGPAVADSPRRENDPPTPVSHYGQSKLAGENEVRHHCRVPFTILRPPAVYGPRDGEFLKLFKAVQSHLRPEFGGGRQVLSLVYVAELTEAIIRCLDHPRTENQTYFVSAPETITTAQMGIELEKVLQTKAYPLPLPTSFLWPVCVLQEMISRLTGISNVINRQKYAELAAPGWVCDGSQLQNDIGYRPSLTFATGATKTLEWYYQEGWMKSKAAKLSTRG